MGTLELDTAVRKVGNSLAIFLPADQARAAGLQEGSPVHAVVDPNPPDILGLLRGMVPYEPFERRKEGSWRDRL